MLSMSSIAAYPDSVPSGYGVIGALEMSSIGMNTDESLFCIICPFVAVRNRNKYDAKCVS